MRLLPLLLREIFDTLAPGLFSILESFYSFPPCVDYRIPAPALEKDIKRRGGELDSRARVDYDPLCLRIRINWTT